MAKDWKKVYLTAAVLVFVGYFFAAARPIPPETVLVPRWLSSLESDAPVMVGATPVLLNAGSPRGQTVQADGAFGQPGLLLQTFPFTLSGYFGYVDSGGRFLLSRAAQGGFSMDGELWAEYDSVPDRIAIFDRQGESVLALDDPRGYVFFLDGRIFLLGSEQNALSEIDRDGAVRWSHEFDAPLACIDAAAGLVLTGSIDGVVAVLDSDGRQIFSFEPGGSRHSVIVGCAMSRDGSRLGIVSGIDRQRFLLLEHFGSTAGGYKVVYHEFLEEGFRRPVHISFIDSDRWLVFERAAGLGVYEIRSRQSRKIPLEGEIAAIDACGGDDLFFLVASHADGKKTLNAAKLSGRVIMAVPFKSDSVFLARTGRQLVVGGGLTLASFEVGKM